MRIISPCRSAVVLLLFLFVSAVGTPVWAVQQKGKESPAPKENPFTLIFEGNTVKAEIKQARLEDVLTEIARQTALSIEIDGSIADEKVSAEFDPLPVEEGLNAIFRNKNYILVYSEVSPAAGSGPQFTVEGIKIVGKQNGPPPPLFRGGFERERSLPPQVERGGGIPSSGIGESVDEDSTKATMPRSPLVPFFPPIRNQPPTYQQPVPPHQARGTTPYTTPDTKRNPVNSTNSSGTDNRSGAQQPHTPASPAPSRSADERMDDLDNLAEEKGMAAIPILSQAADSDPDPEVREFAQNRIQEVRDDAEWDANNTP